MRRVLPTILSLVLLACNGVPSEPSVALVPEARAAAPSSAPVPATSSGTPSTRPPPIAIGSEPIPVGTRITTTHRSKLSLHLLLGGTRSTQTHDLRFVHRSELLRAGPEDLTFRLSVLEQIVPSEAPGTPAHGPLEGKTYVLRCGRDGHVRVTPPVPSTGSPAVPLDPSDLETVKSSVGCAPWFRRWPGVPSTLAAGDRVPLAGSVLFLDRLVHGEQNRSLRVHHRSHRPGRRRTDGLPQQLPREPVHRPERIRAAHGSISRGSESHPLETSRPNAARSA